MFQRSGKLSSGSNILGSMGQATTPSAGRVCRRRNCGSPLGAHDGLDKNGMTTLCKTCSLLTCSLFVTAAAQAATTPLELQGIWDRQPTAQQSEHPGVV